MLWHFRRRGTAKALPWNFDDGDLPVGELVSVRTPKSSAVSRHIPASAWSHTTGSHLSVESGLEHDLVRLLDRDHSVKLLVTQPAKLTWPGEGQERSHVPDLLSCDKRGQITIWDVRPTERQCERFADAVEVTSQACDAVGWQYRVFGGTGQIERLNLLWLHRFRRPPEWLTEVRRDIECHVRGNDKAMLGDLLDLDTGDGRTVAAVWHLMWTGTIWADMTSKLDHTASCQWIYGVPS